MVDRNYTTDTEAIIVTATSGGANADLIYTCPPNHDATVDFLHVSNGASSTMVSRRYKYVSSLVK